VIYGGRGGLREHNDQQFTQATPGVDDIPEQGDRFGAALAAGDLDADGFADLAIGVPGEGLPTGLAPGERDRPRAAVVHVLYAEARTPAARGGSAPCVTSPTCSTATRRTGRR
jgi:hypothetical protein